MMTISGDACQPLPNCWGGEVEAEGSTGVLGVARVQAQVAPVDSGGEDHKALQDERIGVAVVSTTRHYKILEQSPLLVKKEIDVNLFAYKDVHISLRNPKGTINGAANL
jgi:hypothetical protein